MVSKVPTLIAQLLVALAVAGAIPSPVLAGAPLTPRFDDGGRGTASHLLSDEDAHAIAIRFAPRFRFHPDETFLPVHPLFVLGTDRQEWPQGIAAAQALGFTGDRIRRYLALTQAEKRAEARVFYEVYRDERMGPGRIVVEYWLYFVESRYRTRRGFFPFSLDLSHPNDFEHVFLVLAPAAGSLSDTGRFATGLVIERIITNVHNGRIPNHVTPATAGGFAGDRPLVLVELGSHSLAPDVDEDGRVVTRLDVEPRRITWGLRDTGRIWAWRSFDDAETRESDASTTLRAADAPGPEGDSTYQLELIAALDADFRRVSLAPAQEDVAFRGEVHPLKRLFGKSDGVDRALRRPSSSLDHGDAVRLLNDSSERQRGLSLGFTNIVDSYAVMVSGRFPLATPPQPWPALTADVGLVFPSAGPVIDAEVLASYEIDTQVDLIGGFAWLADGRGQRQADWLVGLQLQLGRFRFRGVVRGAGVVNNDQADFRVQYDLWK